MPSISQLITWFNVIKAAEPPHSPLVHCCCWCCCCCCDDDSSPLAGVSLQRFVTVDDALHIYNNTPPPPPHPHPPPPLHTFLFTTFLFWMFLPPKHDTAILLFTSQIFLWVKTMSRPVLKYFLASYRVKCFLKISCIIFHPVWEVSQSWMHQDIFLCVLLWVRCPLGNIPLHTFSKQCYLICPKEILQGCP